MVKPTSDPIPDPCAANPVPLEAVLLTGELARRPRRAPDHETENRALVNLAQALADAPRSVLQALAETLLVAMRADSAGISLLSKDEQSFYWPAIAGAWHARVGGGTPRDFGPCGDVLDCNGPLLFKRPERRYPYLLAATPLIEEALLVPFHVAGKAVGTLWVIAHDSRRQFDAEDLRQLQSLGRFASAAYRTVQSLDTDRAQDQVARQGDEDITERKRAEERLRSNRDTFFDVIENAPFGVYVIDAQFRMCRASAVSLNVFSNVQPLIGRDFEEIVRAVWTEPFATEVLGRFRHTLETGEPYAAPSTSELRKDIPQVESYDWKIQRVTLADGQFGVLCYFDDFTERKLAEDALRERDAFTRSIIKSSPDCIKVLDLEGNLLSMQSGQELLGIEDIQPFLNTSWIAFWEGEHRQAARAAVESAVAGKAARFVGFFRTLRGEPKWWDVAVSPISGIDSKPARLLSVSRDVTQRKQAELNLAFLASTSRDLERWTSVNGMLQTIGAKVAAHLQLSICAFVEIDETAEQAVIEHDWHREDVPSLVGVHRLADFVGDEFIRLARAGEVIVVRDAVTDPRTDPETFAALKIASFLCVPLIRDGQWRFALCLYKSEAYDWQQDEIEMTRELTARIWTRMERLRAEAALRQSEERFRALVTASSDVVYRMSPDWTEMRQLHGQNFIADTVAPNDHWLQEYIHPDDQAQVVAVIHEAIRTKSLFEMQHRVRLVDGSLGWTFSHAVPLLDAAGEIVEWFGTASDVTEHKRAETALRESEDRYRNLFNSMDEGYCIIEMIFDAHDKPVDWCFLDVNPAFAAQTGLVDAVGKRMREIAPEHEAYWFETYGKVALTGEAIRFVNQSKALGDRWFDLYAFKVGGSDSRKVAVLFNNITESKKSAEALAASEARFRALFDSGPIAMYSVDAAGTIQEYNRHAVTLWGRKPQPGALDERFCGAFKWHLPDGRALPPAQTPVAAVLRGEIAAAHDVEVVMERPDGSRIDVIANVVPLKNGDGEITGAMNSFYDVTERSRLERTSREQAETLIDLDRRKDEFLAMLSHELRNPLAPLSNAVHMLRLQKNEEPLQRQARNIIERQVGQLNHLVGDLLEISRITTGRVQLRLELVTLGGIVERAVETTEQLVAQRRHALTVSMPPQPVWLSADAARLEQVLVNLLTNAAKYTDEGGRIGLKIEVEGETAVMRVSDNGIGIAPELLPRIFDLFTQAERSIDRSQGGLGIGLCLVQRLVELHGGTVTADSVLGQGSEFVVRLPAIAIANASANANASAVESSPSSSPSAETVPSSGRSRRVLVVDDNVDLVESLVVLMKMSGHTVWSAHDGLTAIEVARAQRPDVVFLDIGLPLLSGYEVAKRLRQHEPLANVVLVAMTGYGQATDRQLSQQAGFDHHLVKPADFAAVQKILASVPLLAA